ncbi:Leucine-, isoleucine-, valine-, threonine-, and alanine-binding protein precursor [Variovorax sp. SRS16]|uniref:amino acid ABC transporter substrate-binding protein n=1 Tax=Variovorax sp. SRS16 TaxID=282217 RepID=UPI00131817F6|nr:amino acid ABC transporter substrate-binding protein [Variovorax sp. SRS16]VTU30973.1 Leucine-, isoleucine-, valine-, threonine-, and alanine-binding protein precursor [Variovorax sp. SRS16]
MNTAKSPLRRRAFLAAAGTLALAHGLPAHAQQGGGTGPIRVGGTLPLTGPLAPVGGIHKVAGEVFVEALNKRGGLLGRKLEFMLLDDQSQPGNTRTLYERLITAEKVDLLMGPYGTSSIIAAMGVAQRFGKLFIQSSLGDPSLAPYDMQFPALPLGPEPRTAATEVLLDAYASTATPPKTIAFVTSKFPSALDLAKGGQEVAAKRGLKTVLSLEYEFGTRDFGGIAARIKDAGPDLLWSGAIGLEAAQLLDAMKRIDYQPARQFHLFPAPGPTVSNPQAGGLTTLTWFEDHAPFTQNAGAAEFIASYNERAKAAGLPWPHVDSQAAAEFAAWQMLEAAASAVGRLDDKAMAAWLKAHPVNTVLGTRRFDGKFNSGAADTKIKQAQNGKWVTVWPAKFRPPEAAFVAP